MNICANAGVVDIKSLLHVNDANASQTLTWSIVSQPSVDGTVIATAATASSGSTNVTPGGTLTYQAATGYTTESFKMMVSDGAASDTITVVVNIGTITSSVSSKTNIACNGGSTGAATVLASGGTPAYTFSWAPSGGTAATATGLSAGTYTCTITDDNLCTQLQVVAITEPTTSVSATFISQTDIECRGAATGIATISASGGTGTIAYSWAPSGGAAATATGLTAGTYTCTASDDNGCSDAEIVTITEPATGINSSITSQTNIDCNGNATGAATVTASGGAGTLLYSWAPSGGTLATATGLTAGTHTCTITDDNFCTHTQTVTITQPSVLASNVSAITNVSCNGLSNGAATVSASGGTPGYTYGWAPSGGTAATATGLAAGTYTVTISDANSCSKTQTVTVSQPSVLTSNVGTVTNVSCNGGSNGAATVSASGGTPTYSFSWAPSGGTAASATGLAAGTYTVTIDDANSCSTTQTVTVSQPTALSASVSSVTNVSCNGGTNGAATVSVSGGTPAYTFSWSPSGGTAASATGLAAGNYTVTIEDANSCSTTQAVTVSQPTVLSSSVSSVTNVSCNGGTNGAATVSVSGGTPTYTFSWAPSGGTTATATGLAAGSYTVAITDDNSCAKTQIVTITQPSVITSNVSAVTNVSCNGLSNGAATVSASGGTPGYTYGWAPSGGIAATATGLAAGIYTVTIGDANSCSKTQTVTVTEPTILTSNVSAVTNVSCNGGSNGAATVSASGGTPTYSFSWAPSGGTAATATGLAAGTYTVTINDANSCSTTQTVTVTEPTVLSSSVSSVTNVSCNGGTNGAATVSASGGTPTYSFSWAPSGGTAATATGLAAGSYTVTINDANSCSTTQAVTVTQPSAITSSVASQTNIDCNGNATGAATITAAGGTGTLLYSWAPSGGTAATATGLTAGTYTCTITDGNLCSHTQTVTITQPSVLNSNISGQTNVTCHGGNDGAAIVAPNGGTIPYSYSWSPIGGTAATGTGFTVGSYTCTVTDGNGCMHDQVVAILEPALPVATIGGTTAICKDENADVIVNGPAGTAVSYTINGGTLLSALMNANGADTINSGALTATATYALVDITEGTCTYPSTGNAVITVKPFPTIDATTDQSICNGAATTPVIFTGSVSGTLFTWTNDNTTTGIAATATDSITSLTLTNNTTARIFSTIIVTPSANGCTGISDTFEIVSNPTPMLTTTLTAVPVCNTTLFTYVPASATVGTTFAWSRAAIAGISKVANNGNDDPNETLTNTTADPIVVTYVYTLTANSCTNTQNVTVTVQPTPMLSSTLTPAAICNNTTFNYAPTSATTGTVFNWSRAIVAGISNTIGAGTNDPNEVLTNTTTDPIVVTYVYTLTANSCSHTENVTVTVNPTPLFTSAATVSPLCDSTLLSYTPTSATVGTTYSWSRAAVTGISNAAGTGTNDPMEYLVNTTPDPVNVIYVYTLTANSCSNLQSVTTTIYPKPLLSTTLTPAAICDSSVFSYTPASLTVGTTYIWSRAVVAGISNPANADNTDPVENLYNTTTDPVAVTYVYTLTANGCTNSQNVVVVVNPTPVFTSTLAPAAVCDSTLFTYTPTSATTGTAFTWSRAIVAGISNTANTGTSNPMEYLVNTTPDPITVTYVYTLTANTCSHVQSVSVVVNPKPLLTTTLTPPAICDSTLFSYAPASATVGTVFTWSRATVAGIANTAANGSNDPMEYLDNTTANPLTVVYIDTLFANGCYNTQAVSVVVNSTPMLSSTSTPAAICNNTTFNYTPTSATIGTAFTWTRATVTGISNVAGSGTNNPAETLNNTTNHQVAVTYIYTLIANGCSNTQTVTVTVNPTPVLSSLTTATVCSSTPLVYTPGSTTTGTTFAWTRAVVAGISNAAATSTG
ncbi:hypothetical protein CJD36_022275, partial [Flavipsychrobacter stenotrophus]